MLHIINVKHYNESKVIINTIIKGHNKLGEVGIQDIITTTGMDPPCPGYITSYSPPLLP